MFQSLIAFALALAPMDPGAAVRNPAVAAQLEPMTQVSDRLMLALREGRNEDALAIAKGLAARPDFATLNERGRAATWHLIGELNLDLDRPRDAIAPLRTALTFAVAPDDVWFRLIEAYARADQIDAAVGALAEMARARPQAALNLNDRFVFALLQSPDVADATDFAARDALWDAGWRADSESFFWLAYVDGLLERGKTGRAREVLPRIVSSSALIRLHAAARYADLAGSKPLDLQATLDAELERTRAEAGAADADMDARLSLVSALFERGRFDEALAAADAVLALPDGEPGSDDWRAWTWTMDTRARTLMALGRVDEAVEQMRAAAGRSESGGRNVSQSINLGWFLLRAGRDAEALAAVEDIAGDDVSAFGLMQAVQVRACAAQALGLTEVAAEAYAHLESHWSDAPRAYQDALACRGDVDGFAAVMIRRLEDPDHAEAALSEMHAFLPAPNPTDFDRRLLAIEAEAFARPAVIAARDRVGRVFAVPTLPGQF